MAVSKYFTGTLYQRMSDDLHLAGMSERTHGGQQFPASFQESSTDRTRVVNDA